MNKFTIVKLEIPAGGHLLMFYDPVGMLVGSCAGCTGKYGEDPNVAISRGFIDDQSAIEWVKRKCRETHPAARVRGQGRNLAHRHGITGRHVQGAELIQRFDRWWATELMYPFALHYFRTGRAGCGPTSG